jgi:hypothetical protein
LDLGIVPTVYLYINTLSMYANGFLYEWNVPLRFKCIVTSLFEYSCLSVTCDRSVVFSTNKPDYHDIAAKW